MGGKFLSGVAVCLLLVTGAGAENYSCRDAAGTLYFSDSPANLPAECLGKEEKLSTDSFDKLNIVPATPAEPGAGFDPEEETRTERYEQQRQQVERLQQRAEQLLKTFQRVRNDKRAALRRWSYQSREEIKKADQQLAEVQDAKQQLLKEVEGVRMLTEDRERIRRTLDSITND